MTKRSAKVFVRNATGKKLKRIDVFHKYSDNYRNHTTWENIENSENTPTMSVQYNTGAFTTGRDWWLITWLDENNKFYFTNPNNLRGFVDFMESFAKNWLEGMAKQGVTPQSVEGADGLVRLAIGVNAAVFLPMLNSESTVGFKQHILRSEDADQPTEIILNTIKSKEPVKFHSKSGNSVTVYKEGNLDELKSKIKGF